MIVSHRKTISDDFSSNHGSSNNNSSSRGYGVSSSFRRITWDRDKEKEREN